MKWRSQVRIPPPPTLVWTCQKKKKKKTGLQIMLEKTSLALE
jgi:hypothetical protein